MRVRTWMWSAPRVLTVMLSCAAAACGGRDAAPDAGPQDAGRDAPGVWTPCASPSGYAVCGGPNRCPPDSPECMKTCTNMPYSPTEIPGPAALCWNDPFVAWRKTSGVQGAPGPCGDGNVMIRPYGGSTAWLCVPFEVGELMARSGAVERVCYADGSTFTNTPIPSSASCPQPGAAKYCGLGCGSCGGGEVCWGLSPTHPIGMCLPGAKINGCGVSTQALCGAAPCFIFRVQPEAQSVADEVGQCLQPGVCEEAASKLGGKCVYAM